MRTFKRLLGLGGAGAALTLSLAFSQTHCGLFTPSSSSNFDFAGMEPPDLGPLPDLLSVPAPTVTSIMPNTALNNAMTAVIVAGTNFRPGALVKIGGVTCNSVAVVSPTQITCIYPGKSMTCGGQDVVVTQSDDVTRPATLPASMGLSLSSSSLGFAAANNVAVAPQPDAMAVADFNNDGNLDLAVASLANNVVQVRLGLGNGSFMTATDLTVGTRPAGLTAVDFNGDGKPDLISANQMSNNISVLLNMGTSFTAAMNTTIAGAPVWVAASDFNGDTKTDLAIVLNSQNEVAIRLGNGSGGFLGTQPPNVSTQVTPAFVAIGDYNGDTKKDLAVSNTTTSTISVRPGNNDGTFGGGFNLPIMTAPQGLAMVDVNNDGKHDLLVTQAATNNVGLFLSNGTAFGTVMTTATATTPRGLSAADLNGDGKVDFVVSNLNSGNVSVRLGNGAGAFTGGSASDYTVQAQPSSVIIGDFNKDGMPDIAAANTGSGTVSLLLQRCQ